MRAVLVIMGIVVILAIVSLPGAAMVSKADLLASYPPSHDRASMMAWVRGSVRCGDCTPEPWSNITLTLTPTWTPTPIPTKPTPTPTPSPLTLDVYHIGVWIYPHVPASYYEWSKFPPEPTPRVISDEEWEEAMAKFYEYMAKHDAIRVLA